MSSLQKDLFNKSAASKLPPYLPREGDDHEEVIEEEDTFDANSIAKKVYETPATKDNTGPIFVLHHGAGYSGLSFALCASNIRREMEGTASILAYDCRGHGFTRTSDDTNLSLDRLSEDLVNVVNLVYSKEELKKHDIFLIGHSMGGCVVAHAASKRLLPSVTCVAVLDVVEGSAMEALSGMHDYLRNRPDEFRSVEHAIEWNVKSGTIHNLASAKISVPSLVIEEIDQSGAKKYVWRTKLEATQQYWEEWFKGMSEKFLSANAAKLLILAGTDRLDKPLTIAQMQGKYQLHVMPEAGHMLQEDAPDRTATALVDFFTRNERLVLPVKKLTL
ncbi:11392_t:CDS:2 [Ambispora gerdemannii]|uniref:Protein phosphatase methylesterase 1 n=1 Tax=Ambispora gerdemannii TaxID=144530 RepID=A0A9N8VZT4_9GLOM|nr:11392_t:CDS:2 [Ambispora gerdemannii]